jgi:transcriptional regulator with XRE-family HTH domain
VSLSDDVAREVRAARQRRGLTVAQLAARCAYLGAPKLTTQALYKLEGQRDNPGRRPRSVTVDELFILADALQVQVGALLPDMQAADLRHDALSEAIAALERAPR